MTSLPLVKSSLQMTPPKAVTSNVQWPTPLPPNRWIAIVFLAFLPQFVNPAAPDRVSRMLGLSAVFMVMTFVVFVAYGLFAASIRRHVISRPQVLAWMRRCFAAAFVALGVKLALAEG